MIKPDFMTSRIIIAAIITMGGLSYSSLLTVTGQDPNNENSDIILSSKNIRNTTTIGDKIVHRGIVTSEEPMFLVPDRSEEKSKCGNFATSSRWCYVCRNVDIYCDKTCRSGIWS